MHRTPTAAMIFATLLWGATFVVIRDTLHGLDPTVLIWARFSLAAGVFAVILAIRRRGLGRAAWIGGALSGVFAIGGFLFQAIGLTTTSAGTSAFLTSIGTLFAGLFAWPLLGQRPSRWLSLGIAGAVFGASLMGPRDWTLGPGEWWTLLGAFVYALQVVVLARFAPRADPVALTGVQTAVMAVGLTPFVHGAREQIAALPAPYLWRLGYLVVAGSVAAPLLQVIAQRSLPPGRVGLLFALEPVFALVFAVTVGAERFVARWWWGAVLILVSVTMVEWREARRPGSRSSTG